MTWRGPIADPPVKASWVEALAWFSGWSWPLRVVEASVLGQAAPHSRVARQ
jgi:hypothetical protein